MIHDTTIDAREVAHYENLAAFWWDRSGPFWPLHTLNELRVDWIKRHVCQRLGRDADQPQPLRGLTALDIGCGGGILAESIARLGARVIGVDVVEKNIRIAALHGRQSGLDIDYRHDTVANLAEAGERYDLVLNMEVVEHVADLDAFMASCNRVTSPGGAMFIATINRTWLAWLFAIVGAEYVLRWLPRGTHRWREFRRPDEMEALLGLDGFTVQARAGVAVNPLNRTFGLTRSTRVNYMLMAARTDGAK
ncbi:MAG: bifunctional 2-polyprenyl-6-hydroxyphenol methylase/3-demethylubiquinol 3-O-methyltransferase UbiG [Xanthomonadales bacterium]|nr:bifunctional 2-polyprenyl-6-hydroxyphenol methylase/3-demethylubiquinol 3-O-methyltransferase UbiG [Xanthomonadales bacterium]